MFIENVEQFKKDYKFESSTGLRNNKTALAGFLEKHSVAKGYIALITVKKGMLTFKWNDTDETIIIDHTKPFMIEEQREHQVILNWEVEFTVDFYTKNN